MLKFLNFQAYTGFDYFRKYGRDAISVGMQLWKGSEYSRILNMRGFFIYNKLF